MGDVVYLDVCCLKRPFDDQRSTRVQLETAASIWLEAARVEVPFSEKAETRAREILGLGFDVLDALHTAFAEESGARWLVTTDDRLVALGRRHHDRLRVEITNPIHVLEMLTGGEP